MMATETSTKPMATSTISSLFTQAWVKR
jgi:hypothetical protein